MPPPTIIGNGSGEDNLVIVLQLLASPLITPRPHVTMETGRRGLGNQKWVELTRKPRGGVQAKLGGNTGRGRDWLM